MKILIVDDEKSIRDSYRMILEYEGYEIDEAASGVRALRKIKTGLYKIVLLDLMLPDIGGIEIMERLKKEGIDVNIIVITGHGNVKDAVASTKLGAFNFLEKPIEKNKLIIILRNLVDIIELRVENKNLKSTLYDDIQIIGDSSKITEILEVINKVAPSDSGIFIQGENGTGKDLIARSIHFNSKRNKKPFIEVNCAAIPDELIESELFGYEQGAFTNALSRKKGKIELANEGTLFLDEIGDMSLLTQAKVLRVLQFGEFERVGGVEKIRVDIRILAATNKEIKKAIKDKEFREDLYFRLNVIPIFVPTLKERKTDIPILVEYFSEEFFKKNAIKRKKFSKEVVEKMLTYSWPGNIRELRNIVERLIIMSDSKVISVSDFKKYSMLYDTENSEIIDKDLTLKEYSLLCEKQFILQKLEEANWNISRASKLLGVQRPNLYKKLEQLDIRIKK